MNDKAPRALVLQVINMRRKNKQGKLVAITGPMFAGKTSKLIELLDREKYSGNTVQLFKPEIDKRYSKSSVVVTHKGEKLPAKIIPTSQEGINHIREVASGFDVIGVDEAQFWPPELGIADMLNDFANDGKIVYVSILNKDHTAKPFNNTLEILALADSIHSLTSICPKCGDEATFTQRISNGKEVFGNQIQVGGTESYEPRCRRCFVNKKRTPMSK